MAFFTGLPSGSPRMSDNECNELSLLELDLDVDAGRKVQLHEGVNGLLRWVVDVDEPLVRSDLELLARVLVDEGTADDRELLDARGQRDRTGHRRPGPLRRLDDLRRGLIDQLVVVRLEAYPDPLLRHRYAPCSISRLRRGDTLRAVRIRSSRVNR